jgi:hypothetical protein
VGRGNYGQTVKTILKNRYWWLLNDKEDLEKVNFIWTQIRKQDIMKGFRTKLIPKDCQEKKKRKAVPSVDAQTQ